MKYCSKCGKELFDEAVFCPGCGCATEKTPTPTTTATPTNDIIAIREFSEKATVVRNLGIIAAVLMFGIGIIFSIVIWVMSAGLKPALGITTTNPIELAELEAAKKRLKLGTTLSTLPILGIALSIFIGALVGALSMF